MDTTEDLRRGDIVFLHGQSLYVVALVEFDWEPGTYVFARFWKTSGGLSRPISCRRSHIEKIGSVSDLGLTY